MSSALSPRRTAALAACHKAMNSVFKAVRPGRAETHLLQDQFGRDVRVTWRGGELDGLFACNRYVGVEHLTPEERERFTSPPTAERLEAAVGRRAAA